MAGQEFNIWKKQVFAELDQVRKQVGDVDFKKLKLDLICRMLNKLTPNHIPNQGNLSEFKALTNKAIESIPQDYVCKKSLDKYYRSVKPLKSWTKDNYQLIPSGYHSTKWMAIGVGFGLPYSMFISSLLGIFIGLGIGLGIGTYLDKKAEKENKVY